MTDSSVLKNNRFKIIVLERAKKLADLEAKGYSLLQASKKINVGYELCCYAKKTYPDFFKLKGFRKRINPTPLLNVKAIERLKAGVTIYEPPAEVPEPEGVTRQPWEDLESNQCQWSLDTDFFVEASNKFPCCGLETEKDKPFCEYHNKYLKRGWKNEK